MENLELKFKCLMCKVSPAMAAGRAVKNRNSKTNQKRVIRIFQRLKCVLCFMLQDILQKSFVFKTLKPEGLVAFIHVQWSYNFLADTNTCGWIPQLAIEKLKLEVC